MDDDGILDSNYDCDGNCIATGNNLDENGLDCSGVCGGNAVEDICGICDGNVYDLFGCSCPSGIFDECGICNGLGAIYECGCTGIQEGRCDCDGRREDCAGQCGGSNITDVCGNCGDWVVANNCKDDCRDCEGKCGGDAIVDCTGECDGDAVLDCSGECGGSAVEDDCGVCGGDSYVEYELVWQDEFDGDELDLDKWNIEKWPAGAFNEEKQAYTDEIDNIYLADGKLHIRALRETYDPDDNGVADALYTSGRITTKHKGDWQYAKVEVKAQLPLGEGTWPAIWMLPTENIYGEWPASGEIDIMEYVGKDPNNVHSSIHNAIYNTNFDPNHPDNDGMPQSQTKSKTVGDISTSHIYSMIWRKDKIIFFVDGQIILTYDNLGSGFELWPFDQKFNLLINLAIGGTWGGTVSPEIFPVEFIVDYVKVYKQPCD
jgi:beta-glucanase (GH16 family)